MGNLGQRRIGIQISDRYVTTAPYFFFFFTAEDAVLQRRWSSTVLDIIPGPCSGHLSLAHPSGRHSPHTFPHIEPGYTHSSGQNATPTLHECPPEYLASLSRKHAPVPALTATLGSEMTSHKEEHLG
ncbi:conserved hypothetical protein, unlikely [Trypanosoma brucei gambiense DAL972]|uniref:Uncharacterized protein n=1 Tax=Trypanosoma brucei gambiense (strain MHOM/CI/86/DAL972) TaxID=679716 RepID=C9ZYU0_TRYB9|nr:conserved hypothetical protein, unlikely [Trypanosoma brucei gambiense DAL972]CBH14589.1 conserved hypothetical protein, unlikely [Trypanosoma brucei gambiense DAL972]|eukprot:XP_011776855.1 conserved hypothetical protein, unlikely [Trypanosoma brucei gambiense DAL972]